MLEIYTIYGGGMWKTSFDAVVTLLGSSSFNTLMRMAGTFAVLAVLLTFIKQRNPMVFVQWLAIFMLINTILLVPKRNVQIIDISDPAAVWKTDNVPVGLASIASLTTSIGFKISTLYDTLMARPDSVTYSKTGMLFGSQIVAETSDFTTQNPELAQMLPDYVENCVIGDILLNHKYTVNELMNSTDPLGLITSQPSPLRGIFKTTTSTREFLTCRDAATQIRALANTEANTTSATFSMLTRKIFGNRVNGSTLLANAMGESYGYFYAGGMSAAQIMKNNITNSAVRQGVKGFAARSSDTANLLNLATENAATKQRLSWAAGNALATRTLPFAQSLLMLILICLFPLVIALAASNHSLFGLNTLKIYVGGFIYFQMWPVMFAILNYAANFWLQTKTGGTLLVLANTDLVALQHSDVANLAGYLALSIPVLAFYLTKGASAIGSQVAGSVLSSAAFGSAGVAATTADGNWSFNNMSMDNINQNKMDTNLVQRQGQQTWQADNGSTQTMTAGGQTVIDGAGAMSNLPVNMKLSQLASSGFQESARKSHVEAQTALDGYNHSVTSGWSQLSQLSRQTGTSTTVNSGTESSQTTNASRGASMMMSAVESYAKANHISSQEAYNQLMNISNQGSASVGSKVSGGAGINIGVAKVGGEVYGGTDLRHSTGSSRGTQDSHSSNNDSRHDKNSQTIQDFKQGMDMVTSNRVTDGTSQSENAATNDVQQFAATLNDTRSQYHQFTTSSTQSDEYSRMATLTQNESAGLDTNYTQEFVNWAANRYGDKTQSILTSAPTAREAAMEFVNERLKPEIMGDYQQGRSDLDAGREHPAFNDAHIVQPSTISGQQHYPVSASVEESQRQSMQPGYVGASTLPGAPYGQRPGRGEGQIYTDNPATDVVSGTENVGRKDLTGGYAGSASGQRREDESVASASQSGEPAIYQHAGPNNLPGQSTDNVTGVQNVHHAAGQQESPQPFTGSRSGGYTASTPAGTEILSGQSTGNVTGVQNVHHAAGQQESPQPFTGSRSGGYTAPTPAGTEILSGQSTGNVTGVQNVHHAAGQQESPQPFTGSRSGGYTAPTSAGTEILSGQSTGNVTGAQNARHEAVQQENALPLTGNHAGGSTTTLIGQSTSNMTGDQNGRYASRQQDTAPATSTPRHIRSDAQNVVSGGTGDYSQVKNTFQENQNKLHEQAAHSFESQNALQRQAIEQRSENERKIKENIDEINKNRSTVQASSDILKDENSNAQGKFLIGQKVAQIDQQIPGIDVDKKRELEQQLAKLKERQAKGEL
ncbi:conjugal transfer mating pair stabilization protein TraG [Escherichia coli]|uniref:conjugal transfer mating-pair stabilization protein TraG n=2 Tax=Atlantibacter hermannii TaxID=565 RepID=UPI00254E8E8F|nr:conjugal transfer mating-pair stabilization protein TraG [Atlantibacter hermannii]ELR8757010.1 conjugal transfer mating pair stabilization protein TraG [Escherichia coli]